MGIEIDREHSIPLKRQPLSKIERSSGLSRSTFKVDTRKCLKTLTAPSPRQEVQSIVRPYLRKIFSELSNLFERIKPSSIRLNFGGRTEFIER